MVKCWKIKQVKKLFFQLVFSTYLLVILIKFWSGALIGWGIQFRIQRVPTCNAFGGPHYTKNEKYMKKCDACISNFSCRGVHQKYAEWVLVGCGIELPIQLVLLIEIWVKPQGDKLKIRVQNVVFFLFFL